MSQVGAKLMKTRCAAAALAALMMFPIVQVAYAPAVEAASCPWMNTADSPAQRAQMLVDAMTTAQKIALVHQSDKAGSYYGAVGHVDGIPSLCIPDLVMSNAGQGVGDQFQGTTAFPSPIAQTASWDPALQEKLGANVAWQAWHKGVNVLLAPGLDIGRVPMNGRNWEYMGEDPYLAGQTAAAEVRGIQSQHVIATLKHYVLNDQEKNRQTESSVLDARTFHEIYFPGFETAIEQGGAAAVMCSYNRIGGTPACQDKFMLTDYLRGIAGFAGFVMSDWGATHSTAASVAAGLDMDMAGRDDGYYSSGLTKAVENGTVSTDELNQMVFNILSAMFEVGLFDNPAPTISGASRTVTDTAAEQNLALRVALAGMVLLQNNGSLLPLSTRGGDKIAVIGKTAAPGSGGVGLIYNGWGSGHVPGKQVKPGVVSPLQGLQARAKKAGDTVTYNDGSSISSAASAAQHAKVAIVFAYNVSGEGTDLPSLSLDAGSGTCSGSCTYSSSRQDELIAAVAAANPNTVVVLNTAGPVLTPWAGDVKSIVEAWYPGEQYGNAIADILYGDVNPGGKLPETFPQRQSDLPTAGSTAQYPGVNGTVRYNEGLEVGYRWYDAQDITPAFCFGEGLSYTTFGYTSLSVTRTSGGAKVSFTLTNTGHRTGAEVAQVYVGFPASVGEPPEQLQGYSKINLRPGHSARVTIQLGSRAFQWWDNDGWATTPGTYQIMVGSSSCDIRLNGTVSI